MQQILFRYAVAAMVLASLYGTLRYRSSRIGLGLTVGIGLLSWLFTWAPLERPYGLEPGTEVSFDTALATSGSARGDVSEGFVSGQRNPRPLWSLLWYLVAPGNPLRVRALLPFLSAAMLVLLPWAVAWFRPKVEDDDPWVGMTCAFTAVLASSVPLDAYRPFSLFHDALFFEAPHRAFTLVLALVGLGLIVRERRSLMVGGVVLGLTGFLDWGIFVWSALALAVTAVLDSRRRTSRLWMALVPVIGVAALQIPSLATSGWLRRIPSSEEVAAYRLVFRDVFAITGDMEWIFALGLLSVPLLWKRGGRADLGVLSMLVSSYAVWLGAAFVYPSPPFSDPATVFHLLRFSVALAAGVSSFELARRVARRRKIRDFAAEPLAFAIVVGVLIPGSAAFLWQPWKLDPLYHSSLLGWDTSVARLERWMLENTNPDEIVLTGDDTGEWIASLTGRRVFMSEKLLGREEARERRLRIRRLFLSGEAVLMREALVATRASVVVLDPALREVYWQLDESSLESSGTLEKVGQIGDRYSIYRVRREIR